MLLGRGAERQNACTLLDERRPFVVVGEAGVGKTALVRAATEGRTTYEGGGLSTLQWMPYLAFERALGRRLPEADPEWIASEIARAVGNGVLFIDDAQWTDRLTRDALTSLADRVAVAASVRSGSPGADEALEALTGFERIDLAPLDEETATEFARSLRPDLADGALGRLLRRAGGNPLLIEELTKTEEPSDSLRLAVAARI